MLRSRLHTVMAKGSEDKDKTLKRDALIIEQELKRSSV